MDEPSERKEIMANVTPEWTFGQIHDLPEFGDAADYIVPVVGEQGAQMAAAPLMYFGQIGWSPEGMAEGFNRIAEICAGGEKVYYPLWTEEEAKDDPAVKERYLIHFPVEKKTPFVLISCGGAYIGAASMIEGFPTCKEINDLGYHVFTLNYRASANAKAPNPIEDMAIAVKYIMDHAEELNVDVENYAVGGFSAGGHLAASFGTEINGWKKYGLPAPAAEILGYPVITMGEFTHADSRANFLQDKADDEAMRELWSVEKQVTPAYPPSFIWQCERDNAVPIENTRMLTEALKEAGVPVQYVTYDSEWHGWGSGKGTLAEGWTKQAVAFWEGQMK